MTEIFEKNNSQQLFERVHPQIIKITFFVLDLAFEQAKIDPEEIEEKTTRKIHPSKKKENSMLTKFLGAMLQCVAAPGHHLRRFLWH